VDLENAEEYAANTGTDGQCDIRRDLADAFNMCDKSVSFQDTERQHCRRHE
jgi:hypothetical protein